MSLSRSSIDRTDESLFERWRWRVLYALHGALQGALHVERRFEPWFRRPLNALLREPIAAVVQWLIDWRRPPVRLALAEESIDEHEGESLDEIIDLMAEQMRGRFVPGRYERGGNTKTHGLVRATFTVRSDLPGHLRHGILGIPRTYPAWVRFSGPGPDVPADIRDVGFGSMAVKLMDVPGEKLSRDERFTQDLITISTPTFVTPNVRENAKLQYWSLLDLPVFYFLNPRDPHLLDFVMQGLWNETKYNPLGQRYWSCVPYLLGEGQAMMYSFVPRTRVYERIEGLPFGHVPFNYLRENMAKTLAERAVRFDFCVQVQTDPHRMPIENASVRWPESLSPFIPVATVDIPQQRFDTPAQFDFARHLRINPWHALAAHRPLGNQSRARKRMYETLSAMRLRMNDIEHREPTGDEHFDDGRD